MPLAISTGGGKKLEGRGMFEVEGVKGNPSLPKTPGRGEVVDPGADMPCPNPRGLPFPFHPPLLGPLQRAKVRLGFHRVQISTQPNPDLFCFSLGLKLGQVGDMATNSAAQDLFLLRPSTEQPLPARAFLMSFIYLLD